MADGKRGTFAVLTLIFGIVGLVISWVLIINYLGFAFSVAAIVLGTIELTRISKGTTSAGGRGLTITGMVLGAVAIIVGFIVAVIL